MAYSPSRQARSRIRSVARGAAVTSAMICPKRRRSLTQGAMKPPNTPPTPLALRMSPSVRTSRCMVPCARTMTIRVTGLNRKFTVMVSRAMMRSCCCCQRKRSPSAISLCRAGLLATARSAWKGTRINRSEMTETR